MYSYLFQKTLGIPVVTVILNLRLIDLKKLLDRLKQGELCILVKVRDEKENDEDAQHLTEDIIEYTSEKSGSKGYGDHKIKIYVI